MMKKILLALSACFLTIVLFSAFPTGKPQIPHKDNSTLLKLFPANVGSVLDNSCFRCHTTGSKNADAKKEVNFNEWEKYSIIKKVNKLKKMCETVTEGEMPPEKFLNIFPQKKLTEEEVKVLCDWVKTESESMVKSLN